jgi:cytochrome c-type biogenesis protein CcsB
VWGSDTATRWSVPLLTLGVVIHAVPIILRWVRVDHGPYINAFEVLSSSVWIATALLSAVALARPRLRVALGPALAVCVLLMGAGVLQNPEVQPLPPTFRGVWLVIHIIFAKLATGSILIASGIAVVYLIRHQRAATAGDPKEAYAGLKRLDLSQQRFVAFGFIFVTLMISAGAIWANDSWGRYWSWDPIETWSLATWVAYGLFLHARLAFKVRGRVSAVAVIGLLVLSIVAFFVIALISPTVHTEFMVT